MALNLSLCDDNSIVEDGKWFDYDEDVKFKLRYLSPEMIRRLRKPYEKTKWRRGEKVVLDLGEKDTKKFNADLYDHAIADWEGVTEGEENKKAPVTKENKDKLISWSSTHAAFILETSTNLDRFVDREEEDKELKNSKSSSNLD